MTGSTVLEGGRVKQPTANYNLDQKGFTTFFPQSIENG
jgi:hypothetical protein